MMHKIFAPLLLTALAAASASAQETPAGDQPTEAATVDDELAPESSEDSATENEAAQPVEEEAVPERIATGEPAVDIACRKVFLTLDAMAAGTPPAVVPTSNEVRGCQTMLITSGTTKIANLAKLDVYLEVRKSLDSEETAILDKNLYTATLTNPETLGLLNSYLSASYGLAGAYDVYVLPNAEAALSDAKGAIERLTAKAEAKTITESEMDNLNTLKLVLPIKQKKVATVKAQIQTLYMFGYIAQITAMVTSLKADIDAPPPAQ